MKSIPQVRFAPSPTGELHLGGARTALFNYLYARQKGGKFYIRIEDTDIYRSKQVYVEQICDSLKWLQLNWDSPIVYQSKRKTNQIREVQRLVNEGNAYRCFCTIEELEKERAEAIKTKKGYMYSGKCRTLSLEEIKIKLNSADPFCVRIKIPKGKTMFTDLIYGKISVLNKEIDDFIIQRTDGTPTYNMAVVVDDSDMKITHVIRGEDHLTNTPKQIIIYKLLRRKIPKFAHLPMILGPDGQRLSKRHGALGVQEFRNQGYLPQALLNYLALLGWNPDSEQEVFTIDELKKVFHIEQIQKKGAIYDDKKLKWMNGLHMVQTSAEELLERIRGLNPEWRTDREKQHLFKIMDIQKKRIKTLSEIITLSDFFFEDPVTYDPKTVRKRWKDESVNNLVKSYVERLSQLMEWNEHSLELELRELSEEKGIHASDLIHATRLAISGVSHGPSLFVMMEVLGRETCFRRMKIALMELPGSLDSNEAETVAT